MSMNAYARSRYSIVNEHSACYRSDPRLLGAAVIKPCAVTTRRTFFALDVGLLRRAGAVAGARGVATTTAAHPQARRALGLEATLGGGFFRRGLYHLPRPARA